MGLPRHRCLDAILLLYMLSNLLLFNYGIYNSNSLARCRIKTRYGITLNAGSAVTTSRIVNSIGFELVG